MRATTRPTTVPVAHAAILAVVAALALLAALVAGCSTSSPGSVPASGKPGAIDTATPYARPPDPTIVTGAGTGGTGGSAAPGSPTTAATPGAAREVTYTVASGDTLLEIAGRYDTTVEALVRRNNLPNAAALRIGQELIIPGGASVIATVTPVATRAATATPSATPRPATATATPAVTPRPATATSAPAPGSGGGQVYVVVSGDTANLIALRFGITLEQLAQANNRTPSSMANLQIGDRLNIPSAR